MDTGCLRQRFSVIETRHRSSSPWQRRHTNLMWPFLTFRVALFGRGKSCSPCIRAKKSYRYFSVGKQVIFRKNLYKLINKTCTHIYPIVWRFGEIPFFLQLHVAVWSIFFFRGSYFNQTAAGSRKKRWKLKRVAVNEALSSTLVRLEFILRP